MASILVKIAIIIHTRPIVIFDSYLLIRGFHNREDILQARLQVLKAIKKLGPQKLDDSRPWEEGVLDHRCDHGCIPSFQVCKDTFSITYMK